MGETGEGATPGRSEALLCLEPVARRIGIALSGSPALGPAQLLSRRLGASLDFRRRLRRLRLKLRWTKDEDFFFHEVLPTLPLRSMRLSGDHLAQLVLDAVLRQPCPAHSLRHLHIDLEASGNLGQRRRLTELKQLSIANEGFSMDLQQVFADLVPSTLQTLDLYDGDYNFAQEGFRQMMGGLQLKRLRCYHSDSGHNQSFYDEIWWKLCPSGRGGLEGQLVVLEWPSERLCAGPPPPDAPQFSGLVRASLRSAADLHLLRRSARRLSSLRLTHLAPQSFAADAALLHQFTGLRHLCLTLPGPADEQITPSGILTEWNGLARLPLESLTLRVLADEPVGQLELAELPRTLRRFFLHLGSQAYAGRKHYRQIYLASQNGLSGTLPSLDLVEVLATFSLLPQQCACRLLPAAVQVSCPKCSNTL